MHKLKNKKFKDSDADGLPDEVEKFFGTDPRDPDTDKDGVKDGAEIRRGRNPRGPGLLKDLFIPHAGNDYQPKVLRPYRLLFYALSSILLKVVLIGAIIILPLEAWLTTDILAEQGKKIISLTNVLRENLKLPPLSENALLNQAASAKAEDMLIRQYFSHTGPDKKTLSGWLKLSKYGFAVAGENLAMGFTGPEDVVNAWIRSQTHYQNLIDPEFTEIGVGLSVGPYNGVETTLVAQYLAAPSKLADLKLLTTVAPANASGEEGSRNKTLGEKIEAQAESAPTADITPPEIDLIKSKLYIEMPAGQSQKIVRAEAYLSPDTVSARVSFSNYFLELKPDADENGKWTGQAVIFNQEREQIFNPAVLPAITATDSAGNKRTADLTWDKIEPQATGLLQQYSFIKQHQSPLIKPLFDLTSSFYKIIIIIACLALALNILIKIKKQHPHIILSTFGLIILAAILLAF